MKTDVSDVFIESWIFQFKKVLASLDKYSH